MLTHATALFADRHTARAAHEQLAQAEFPRDAISVAMSEETHEREFAKPPSEESGVRPLRHVGVLGAIVATLAVFATPGEDVALRVTGPLCSALLRAGALTNLVGALGSLGLAQGEAQAVGEGLRNGAIVVAISADRDRTTLAMQLLELSGGASLQAA
jgi:hypothetical protein